MEANNEKRVLNIELNEEVKKVTITGKNSDDQVVMKQELDENDLNNVTGGTPRRIIDVDIENCSFDF